MTCEWEVAFYLTLFGVISTIAGCWAIDKLTEAKKYTKDSKKQDQKNKTDDNL